ncbi:MAG: heme exporter protein CcmB, partial [Pseudomonadales bacterium]|nr:heme exporter protein CcmB [Pseudomonadales bacterium]
ILTLLGGVGAALTVGLRAGGLLLALLVLPLFVPVLILGVGAAELSVAGLGAKAPLLWLATGLAAAVTLAPFAIAGALRIGVETG